VLDPEDDVEGALELLVGDVAVVFVDLVYRL
jgi:hypothetical protein